jgi:guanine deaminase
MKNNYQKYMRLAIKAARKNLTAFHGGPFGACIVKDDEVLAVAANTVLCYDATCHAEVNVIREASKKLKTFDLSGATVYSTTEPCPMCFSALHWARVEAIVYGTSINDAARAGFNELKITNKTLKTLGKAKIKITAGVLLAECQALFKDWAKSSHPPTY